MYHPARLSLLTTGLIAGLAVASISDRVSAEPGHDEFPTTIEAVAPDSSFPALDTLVIEIPEIAPDAAAGSLGNISAKELECMAKVVDHEAANQPRDGQLAVAHVMINRVMSGKFPNTLCGVAYQPRQFSYINSHRIREGSQRWQTALEIAREALSGVAADTSRGALFFHARYIAPNSFFRTRTKVAALEDHIFYR
jgi:spore germination cell wall hydrolase CwlJ-like protein